MQDGTPMPITIDLPPVSAPTPRKPPTVPYLSKTPWWGFSAHDITREQPLPRCPSPRCCRAKACLSATDNLYCLRTHHTPAEQKWLMAHHPLSKQLASVPKVKDRRDVAAIARRAAQLLELRQAYNAAMTARWKAGEFDALYGPFKSQGVLMVPPMKRYVEEGPPQSFGQLPQQVGGAPYLYPPSALLGEVREARRGRGYRT